MLISKAASIAALPPDAQDVFRLAYNAALAEGDENASTAALEAVKLGWEERDGAWIRRKTLLVQKFNPYHRPAGDERGGEFTSGSSGGSGRVRNPGGQWTKGAGRLSEEESEAIDDYTDLGDYLNKKLRAGKALSGVDKKTFANLQNVIKRSTMTHDGVVYRGIGGKGGLTPASFKKIIGKSIYLKGFTSTSKDEDVAQEFGKTLLQIDVPKGTNALDLTQWGGEKEILLSHKTRVKIISVDKNRVHLQVVK